MSVSIAAFLLFSQTDALACGCAGRVEDISKAVNQDFSRAAVVFSGKVISAKFLPIIKKDTSGNNIKAENLVIKFAVDSWWKGKSKNEITLNTTQFRYPDLSYGIGSGCEYAFEIGKRYLVYAVNSKGQLTADECSGTTTIERAKKDIQELQKLKSTKKNGQPDKF